MKPRGRRRLLLAMLGFQLAGSGCLLEKQGARLPMAPEQEAAFAKECISVRAIGDVSRLNKQIEKDVRKIVDLAGAEDPSRNEPKIKKLVEDVSRCADALTTLLKPEFSSAKWQTEHVWEFGPSDLSLLGAGCDVSEKRFTSFQVIQVYWAGAPHPELIQAVRGQLEGHKVRISLGLSQSTLALCELLKVTGVQVRLNVSLCGQADWREFRLSLSNAN